MNYNYSNNCDSCDIELKNSYSYSGGDLFSRNHNFFQAFLTTKGKNKEDNDKFVFCDECEKGFKHYLIEEAIKELNQKSIAYSNLLTHRFFKGDFTEEDWQKFQTALAENIMRHSNEWQIKEVNYQPYVRQKPRKDGNSRLITEEMRKETILYHQSFALEYDQNGSLILENSWDPRKICFKHDLSSEKWTEIETKIELSQKEEQEENQKKTQNQPQLSILIICGIILIFLTAGMVTLLYLLKTRKAKKNKIR